MVTWQQRGALPVAIKTGTIADFCSGFKNANEAFVSWAVVNLLKIDANRTAVDANRTAVPRYRVSQNSYRDCDPFPVGVFARRYFSDDSASSEEPIVLQVSQGDSSSPDEYFTAKPNVRIPSCCSGELLTFMFIGSISNRFACRQPSSNVFF